MFVSVLATILLAGSHGSPDAPCAEPAFVSVLGGGSAGVGGIPRLESSGLPLIGAEHIMLDVFDAAGDADGLALVSVASAPTPFLGGVLHPAPPCLVYPFHTDVSGRATIAALDGVKLETAHCGTDLFAQAFVADAAAVGGWSLTDALRLHLGGPPATRTPLAGLFPMALERPVPLTESAIANDVNGDGRPDLIGLSLLESEGGVQLGLGDSSFGPSFVFPTLAEWPRTVATPDLDGDGHRELVVAHESCCPSGLTTLTGVGDGSFIDPVLQETNFAIFDVAAADADGDGVEDVWALQAPGDLAIHLNALDGTLAPPTLFPTAGEDPRSLSLADVDRDGDLDALMVQNGVDAPHVVSVMRGDGAGFFGPPETTATGSPRPRDLAVGDLDQDGIPDLLVIHPVNATWAVLTGAPGGTFTLGASGPTGDSTPQSVALAHLDDDGHPDSIIAHGNAGRRLAVRRGTGQGTFGILRSHVVSGQAGIPDQVSVADLDGDGVDEVLVADRYMAVVLESDGAGNLVDVRNLSDEGDTHPFALEVGNLDGDGDPDVLSYGHDDMLVFLGADGAEFSAPIALPSRHIGSAFIALADVDGDGLDDVHWSWFGLSGFMVQRSLGGGAFGKPVRHVVPSPTPVATRGLAIGDFDGDGASDVVLLHSEWVSLHRGDGTGRFVSLGKLPLHIQPTAAEEVLLEDLDGDGADELLVLSEVSFQDTGRILVATDIATLPMTVLFSLDLDFRPEHLIVGDVNADTVPDLLVQEWVSFGDERGVQVMLGAGDGSFTVLGPIDQTSTAGGTTLADVTGDGFLDAIVGRRGSSADVSVHPGRGDGTFDARQQFFSGLDTVEDVEAADVDQDGRLDLLMIGSGSDALDLPTVLVNQGP